MILHTHACSMKLIDRALDYITPSISPRTKKSVEIDSTRAVYLRIMAFEIRTKCHIANSL